MGRASTPPRAHPDGRRGRRGRAFLVRRALLGLVLAGGMAFAVPAGAQQASGPLYGPVAPADTLWELAIRFRGDADVTAQQAMIAILRANPDAFGEGNINALRRGVTLRVPSASEMAAITPAEATAEFARHQEAWSTRAQTGTAAPAPAPGAPPAARTPAAPPAPAPASEAPPAPRTEAPATVPGGGGADVAQAELAEARTTIAELRERLAERDAEIEGLLAELFTTRRELDRFRQIEASERDQPSTAKQEAPRAGGLPVNPLVLGSALVVLLVLVVVVTLIRRREAPEPRHEEEDYEEEQAHEYEEEEEGEYEEEEEDDEEEDEDYPGYPDGQEEYPDGQEEYPDGEEEEEVRADAEAPVEGGRRAPDGEERPGAREEAHENGGAGGDGNGTAPPRRVRAPAAAPVPAVETAAAPEDEADDLPFGLDLGEGEERGESAPGGRFRDGPEDLPEPEADPGLDRHVEVGELDDLDLGADPGRDSFPDLPHDPGGEDSGRAGDASSSDPPGKAGGPGERPARPAAGRRRGAPASGGARK